MSDNVAAWRRPAYVSWTAMRLRCLNPTFSGWEHYGGRGITICPEWLNSYATFEADMGPRPDGCTLDRIDVNGNYELSNCRWATRTEQKRNSRLYKNNKSGIIGVHWTARNTWRATIGVNGRAINLGDFHTKEEAAAARLRGVEQYWT